MFDKDYYDQFPDGIRKAVHRGQPVKLTLGPADAVHHQVYGKPSPASVETLIEDLDCAEPESQEELRARARNLARNKSKNARGRQWWNK
jgi:hypothetical protein